MPIVWIRYFSRKSETECVRLLLTTSMFGRIVRAIPGWYVYECTAIHMGNIS